MIVSALVCFTSLFRYNEGLSSFAVARGWERGREERNLEQGCVALTLLMHGYVTRF